MGKLKIPENCCAACSFAHSRKSDLFCHSLPPVQTEQNGVFFYTRDVPVLPNDPPCQFFKPKEHA